MRLQKKDVWKYIKKIIERLSEQKVGNEQFGRKMNPNVGGS